MMKMKPVIWIVIVVVVALVAVVVVLGKQYYEARYVGVDYYAMVPLDYDMTSIPVRNMEGKEIGTGIDYDLTAYNEQGEPRVVSFTVYDPDISISRGEIQPQPGTYLWISASR